MDKATKDKLHTIKSNKAEEREMKIAGSPSLKTKGLEQKSIKDSKR